MNAHKDTVLTELVRKKQSLLNRLLALSIRSAVNGFQPAQSDRLRSEILSMLERNDTAIRIREQQTGIVANRQEREQFATIATLLTSIRENNHATLAKLAATKKVIEMEKQLLEKEKKLTGYVGQSKTMNQYRKSTMQKSRSASRVKGTL